MNLRPLCVALALCGAATETPARPATLDDFLAFPRINEVRLSPDGRTILLSQAIAGKSNVYGENSELLLIDTRDGRMRKLATSVRDPNAPMVSEPDATWSPDSRSLAFLSAQNERQEVWLTDIATGALRQLTRRPKDSADVLRSLHSPQFSPDGQRIAYIVTTYDLAAGKALDRLKTISVTEHPNYLTSGVGRSYIEIAEVDSGRLTPATAQFQGVQSFRWSPDGKKLVLIPASNLWGGPDTARANPSVVDLSSGRLIEVANTPLSDRLPIWSPEGRHIAFLSHNVYSRLPWSRSRSLFVVPAAGGAARKISGDYVSLSYRQDPIVWSRRSNEIYGVGADKAMMRVHAFKADGSGERLVTPPQFQVRSFSLSDDGRTMAAIFENANTPPEVYVGDPVKAQYRKLTRFGDYWKSIETVPVEKVTWRSLDNRFDVEGFLLKPPGYTQGQRYPLLVHTHGGPASAYRDGFLDVHMVSGYHSSAASYAAAGYLVLLCNVRGDEGYGEEFVKGLPGNIGTGDVEQDIFGAVDAMVARGFADKDKVGLLGHSYGGMAGAWAISHTDRFKAASLSDGVYDWLLYYTQVYLRDNQWMEFYLDGTPGENLQPWFDHSASTFVNNIQTPTILRVGNSRGKFPGPSNTYLQAMTIYRSLHQRGVPVEMVIEPTQGHVIFDEEIYRAWIQRNLDWFDYYLRGKGSPVRAAVNPAR